MSRTLLVLVPAVVLVIALYVLSAPVLQASLQPALVVKSPLQLQTVLPPDQKILHPPATVHQNLSQFPSKTILLWTPYFKSYKYYKYIFSRLTNKQCPVSACRVTTKHNELEKADVVVFHLLDFKNSTALPSHHPLNQPWLVFSFEAPPGFGKHSVDFERLRSVMNWTMSYRQDSDVVAPYGVVMKRNGPELKSSDHNYWGKKKRNKMAVWMASHCHTHSRRESYISELRKFLHVDIYGKCGRKSCGKSLILANRAKANNKNCDNIVANYYFYLAFENALCDDYVTEKFYLALTRSVVPVVFGGADYTSLAPPNSYINALDYSSPQQLAQFLLATAANKTAYNSYFAWKAHYLVDLGHPFQPHVCDLCAKLHGAPVQHSSAPLLNSTAQLLHSQALAQHKNPSLGDGLLPAQSTDTYSAPPLNTSKSYPDLKKWFLAPHSCRPWEPHPPAKVAAGNSSEGMD